jgi:pyrroline-5-carboxylate reductase
MRTNEELVDTCDVVFLAMKPQDLLPAVEPIATSFQPHHVVVSLAAGIEISRLKRVMVQGPSIVRVMPNTPSRIGGGVVGIYNPSRRADVDDRLRRLLSPMGVLVELEDEEQLRAILVAAAAGTGFVLELMIYWQDWLEEHKFTPEQARRITVQTFLGTSVMADRSPEAGLEDLQNRVVSKKGVTEAGLNSIRENEIERGLRIGFELAALRDQDLSRQP